MAQYIEKIPYNEDSLKLSFTTLAETVYVDGVRLPEYLASLKGTLAGKDGRDGATIDLFAVHYTCVSDADNSKEFVARIPNSQWSETPPMVSMRAGKPHLWKRTKIVITNNEGVSDVTWDYLYCGSEGTPGIDGQWREWIFKIDEDTEQTKLALEAQLRASTSDSKFLNNDFVPDGWDDDMKEVPSIDLVQWCASRDKINNSWQPFKNLHVFGRKPKDGGNTNNIYTVTPEIDPELWKEDKKALIQFLYYSDGDVKPLPKTINYTWYDDIPNGDSSEIIYQATCYFINDKCVEIDAPIRITGPMGPGSDGNGIEFAYYAAKTKEEAIPKIIGSAQHFTTNGGWYDTAGECPITDSTPYQFVCLRQGLYTSDSDWYWMYKGKKYGKSKTDPTVLDFETSDLAGWNYGWSAPQLWSSWGQDGVDGDGVQYVFLRLTLDEYNWITKYGWEISDTSYDPNYVDPSESGSESGTESGSESGSELEEDPIVNTNYLIVFTPATATFKYHEIELDYKILGTLVKLNIRASGKKDAIQNMGYIYKTITRDEPNITNAVLANSIKYSESKDGNNYTGTLKIEHKPYNDDNTHVEYTIYRKDGDKLKQAIYHSFEGNEVLSTTLNNELNCEIALLLLPKNKNLTYKILKNATNTETNYLLHPQYWVDDTENWPITNTSLDDSTELFYKIVPTQFNQNIPYYLELLRND